jgi:hypothetical protein
MWDNKLQAEVLRKYAPLRGLAELLERSDPRPMDNPSNETESIIDALFPGNPWVCCGTPWAYCGERKVKSETRRREDWRGELAAKSLIVPSPMHKKYGLTQDGKKSERTLKNVSQRRFLVVEFDRHSIDDQSAFHLHLSELCPLVCVVHSGGKSLHGWYYVHGESESEVRKFFEYSVQLGADALQVVRTNQGVECGKILWEAKRAKNCSKPWVEKLKKDQRDAGAELAVLVTTSPPEGLRGFDQYEGIWVCEPLFAVATSKVLRQWLIETAMQRAQVSGRKGKMALLYDYLCSADFRQNIEGVVESFILQQKQLEAERRSFQKQWREREKQLKNGIECTVSIYSDIQGIAGREAIPEIKTLELPGG